ncbi:MAG: DUF692 domain-containing protein [Hyphomicrobiales bacterium]|nr:DUF692 domain-containing protein [Hyphomicrobiales bacterium]
MQTVLAAEFDDYSFEKTSLPARAGVGLKPEHVSDILECEADIGFFEVHAENYMGAGGMPHAQLSAIRDKYALSLHGVGMSIGGNTSLSTAHLERFKAIMDRYQPGMVSEHLAWSTHDDIFYNDLLPAPYTNATLERVSDHIDEMQNYLGRQVLIENPSTYITFAQSTWSEVDFIAEFARRTDCGLLFDVNNVFVSATNHGYSPRDYIKAFPLHLVQEIHLAGHALAVDDQERPLLIDAHDRQVCDDVWALYELTLSVTGPLPSLIEWDAEVPDWPILAEEAAHADEILGRNTKAEKLDELSASNLNIRNDGFQANAG